MEKFCVNEEDQKKNKKKRLSEAERAKKYRS